MGLSDRGCTRCNGTGWIPGPKGKKVRCPGGGGTVDNSGSLNFSGVSTPSAPSASSPAGFLSGISAMSAAFNEMPEMQKAKKVPVEFQDAEWANEVAWDNVPKEEHKAFGWAMDSRALQFYTPAVNDTGDGDLDYTDIDTASQVAHILHTAHNDRDESVTLQRLATETELREYMYLAEDGGNSPAVQVWEEWKANGP